MTTAAHDNREEILQGIRARLEAMPDERFVGIENPDSVSDQMAQLIPRTAPNTYGQLIGPVYTTKALATMWNITRAAISKKAKAGNLLTLKVAGENLVPVFQFHGREVRAEVQDLVSTLQPVSDPFTIAAWLRTPLADEPNGRTPLQLLDDGEQHAAQQEAARVRADWAA